MLKMHAELNSRPRFSILESFLVEASIITVMAVYLPAILFRRSILLIGDGVGVDYALGATLFGSIAGVLLLRRVTSFPGTTAFGYIIPSFFATYGVALFAMLMLRADYSRLHLTSSLVLALATAFALRFQLANTSSPRFYFVPFGDTSVVDQTPKVEWIALLSPEVPNTKRAVIVADLHYPHGDAWERMLAEATIQGHVVCHVKQIAESLTGRVAIEHLSENSFGSLMPNLAYVKVKRLAEFLVTLAILPILLPVCLLIALAIKLDSRGDVLFLQERMGFRGVPFKVFKFRTMRAVTQDAGLDACVTKDEDQRITRVGRFLRRTRLDELPQALNVLRGEMSWIGPRPEAIPLSAWYEAEIPHYRYRHIVRPGISGWAQVNQGHVADLKSVNTKLHYDFFYIKNYSAWLDLLIFFRTISTVISGFGAK